MTEKEKIIKGLECCAQELNCSNCPYNEIAGSLCHKTLFNDFKDYFLNSDKPTSPGLRPCLVNGNKGFFLCWEYIQKVNNILEGEISGQISYIVGLVELQNGQCMVVEPGDIQFTDRSAEKMTEKPKFNADAAEEYFSKLLIKYQNIKEEVFKEDNALNTSCNPIYTDRYEKWLGQEIAMREVLKYFSRFDLN